MPPTLTARQAEILDVIRSTIRDSGRPPTRVEISRIMGFRSPNAAEDHLRALERKGYISIDPATSRGIRLPEVPEIQAALSLPIIGRVAAGSPILAAEHIEAEVQLAATIFSATPDYLLRVRGSSMIGIGIQDGDLLAVKRSQLANSGEIVVARLADEVTVKRLEKRANGIRLLAENPDFAPISIKPGDDFHLEGIAVGLVRGRLGR